MPVNELTNIEEHDLWNSFVQGNDKSLETIYRCYFDELYAYGNKWLKNPSLTEDSMPECLLLLWKLQPEK